MPASPGQLWYADKLQDPRWQRKRLEVFMRDHWQCRWCGSGKHSLVVHHLKYLPGKMPWDYPDELLRTICKPCHEQYHAAERGMESLGVLAPRELHGFAHFVDGGWLCICGCGETWTREQWGRRHG